jgi:hypothetical protein
MVEDSIAMSSLLLHIENSVGNLSPALWARNQVGIELSYRPASLATQYSVPDSVPGIDSSPNSGLKFPTQV